MLAGEFDALGGEGIAPCDKGDIAWVGEKVFVGGWPYIVELAPKYGLFATGAHALEYAPKEWYHELRRGGVAQFLHHCPAVVAFCPVGGNCGLVATQMNVLRGEQCCYLFYNVVVDGVDLFACSAEHHVGGVTKVFRFALAELAPQLWVGCEYGYGVSGDVELGYYLDVALGCVGNYVAHLLLGVVAVVGALVACSGLALRANGGELGVALYLNAPALVVGEVYLQHVELEACHLVYEELDVVDGYEMACRVYHYGTVGVAWRVVDEQVGYVALGVAGGKQLVECL